jgi:hypothetical protein
VVERLSVSAGGQTGLSLSLAPLVRSPPPGVVLRADCRERQERQGTDCRERQGNLVSLGSGLSGTEKKLSEIKKFN